jgi:hypothetical protein
VTHRRADVKQRPLGPSPAAEGAVAAMWAPDMRGALRLALRMTTLAADALVRAQLAPGDCELRYSVERSTYHPTPHVLLFKQYEGRGVYVFRLLEESAP